MRTLVFSLIAFICLSMAFASETIPERRAEISIDGELGDWIKAPYVALGYDSPSEASLSALARAAWDETFLYFAFDVIDEQVVALPDSGLDLRTADCVELFVDTRGLDFGNKNPMSRNTLMALDYFEIENADGALERINDTDSRIQYSEHEWQKTHPKLAYLGDSHQLQKGGGASLSLEFFGKRIKAATIAFPVGGIYEVWIDDEFVERLDFFNMKWQEPALSFDSGLLSLGPHRIEIVQQAVSDRGIIHGLIGIGDDEPPRLAFANSEGDLNDKVQVVAKTTDKGWEVEGRIRWADLNVSKPVAGQTIRYGYKLYDTDDAKEGTINTLGLERHGAGTDVAWMVLNPDRFPRTALTEGQKTGGPQVLVRERLHQGESFVEIKATYPTWGRDTEIERALFSFGDGRGPVERAFRKSAGGNFKVATVFVPSRSLKKGPLDTDLDIAYRFDDGASKTVSLPLNIAQALHRIEATLPASELGGLREDQRNLVLLYKETAQGLLRHYEGIENREVEHYHYLPFFEDHAVLENYIDLFLTHGRLWMIPGAHDTTFYPHQPWPSKADGSTQFFQLNLPPRFDPAIPYPVLVEFHHLNKRRYSRVRRLSLDLSGEESYWTTAPENKGNYIHVKLHGRGNSFETIGDEEFEYVMEWIRKTLPASAGDIRLTGGSYGAKEALRAATRWPRRISMLDARGPQLDPPITIDSAKLYEYGSYYRRLALGYSDKLTNLGNLPIRLAVGELDSGFLGVNRSLKKILESFETPFQFNLIENTKHYIPEEKLPKIEIPSREIGDFPERVTIKQFSLRYGEAFGVAVLGKALSWRPYEFEYDIEEDGSLSFSTRNVKTLSIDIEEIRSGTKASIEQLVIDGQRIEMETPWSSEPIILSRDKSSWEKVEQAPRSNKIAKRPGIEGPIADFEKGGFLIVYGTRKRESTDRLLERARRIARSLTGSDQGQWSGARFRIIADRDVEEAMTKTHNLWLIGSPTENSIVHELADGFALEVSSDSISLLNRNWSGKDLFLELLQPNPKYLGKYIFIEAGQSPRAYSSRILAYPEFDFVLTKFDALENPIEAAGVFDSNWGLDPEMSKIWKNF